VEKVLLHMQRLVGRVYGAIYWDILYTGVVEVVERVIAHMAVLVA
jgi:hypothetical protein